MTGQCGCLNDYAGSTCLGNQLVESYLFTLHLHSFCIPNIAICVEPIWFNDTICDNVNNILECNYDGGDCCQENPADGWDSYCMFCECKKALP